VTRSVDELLDEARARMGPRLSPTEAEAARAAGALLVDIRGDEQRRADGEVPGAVVIPRNVLEWRVERLGDRPVVLLCNEGYQSSLAAAALCELGCEGATDVVGGFQAWRAEGLPVEPPRDHGGLHHAQGGGRRRPVR
jgi:rhodanese-related sulfurtransferase